MQGMTIKSLKKHYYLIPLHGCLSFGILTAIASLVRCAIKNPDISWNLKKNPEPWQEYKNKRYKLLDPAGARGWTDAPQRPGTIWELYF
ncbi:cytochrome c oxidase subunit NDUFA4-like [Leptopilina boulardi]|uniref:cytochrome c oxidase subunit NDUFA4-like n=1 Tax=Leptopilina boulardi TaxID=63433 RepID=UPI0021F5A350|nr:cytochrome c oxidase subunit NDUFA4-like [Leptopilina boulardi]